MQFNRPIPVAIASLLLFAFVVAAIGSICCSAVAQRQPVPQAGRIEFNLNDESSVFVPAPREILRPLMRAQLAIEKGEFDRAVALLGEILSDSTSEDFLVRLPESDGLAISLRNRAQQLLASIDQRDRRSYELRFGVQAKQLLNQAVAERDFEKMSQVMRRFFYTPAVYDAAMLIGHYHLDEGHPVAAAFCFQRVVDTEAARRVHDPEASVLLAACWVLADANDKAKTVLNELKSRLPNGRMKYGGKSVEIFGQQQDPLIWLAGLMGDTPLGKNRVVQQWLLYGGNVQRNAQSGKGFPLFKPKWSVPTLNNPNMERLVKEKLDELIYSDSTTIPAVHPIAIGDTIVMRSFDKMIGVDFKTGKREWVYPPWDTESFFENDATLDLESRQAINKGPIVQRMMRDSVFGQITSDGKRIFAVPAPGFASGQYARLVLQGGMLIAHPLSMRTYNEIKAVDIQRQGAFLWEVGGQSGLNEPKLAKTFFLGPPLPHDGALYAVCEQNGEAKLVVLDPESGKLLWSQQLANIESIGKASSNRDRRLNGATPSYSDGLMICPTGARSLVAVDISTRSLLWGYQYGSNQNNSDGRVIPDRTSGANFDDGLWRNSIVTIADGCVLFTPVDLHEMICLDLLTGRAKWSDENGRPRIGIPRGDSLFLAGVEDGQAILVGLNQVRSINLQSSKEIWSVDISDFGRVSGQGYSSGGHYYLPTTGKQLLKIELQGGNIVKTIATNGIIGNLISHQGAIISHGVDHLTAFPQDEPSRQIVENAELRGDLTPEHLSIKAQLQMHEGNLAGAVESISGAYQQAPDPGNQSLLLDLVIDLVRADYKNGMPYAETFAEELMQMRSSDYLAAQIDGRIATNDMVGALNLILEITTKHRDLFEAESFLERDATHEVAKTDFANGSTINIRFDRWLTGRIAHIFEISNHETNILNMKAISRFVETSSQIPPVQRHDLFRMISLNRVSPAIRLDLANALRDLRKEAGQFVSFESNSSHGPVGIEANSLIIREFEILDSIASQESIATWATAKDAEIVESAATRLAKSSLESLTPATASKYLKLIQNPISGHSPSSAALNVARQGMADLNKTVLAKDSELERWKRGAVNTTYIPNLNISRTTTPARNILNSSSSDSNPISGFQFRFASSDSLIEISNSLGVTIAKFKARQFSTSTLTTLSTYYEGRVEFFENLLLVTIGNEVFAIDWLSVNQSTGLNPVLWTRTIVAGTNTNFGMPAKPSVWGEYQINAYYRYRYQSTQISRPSFQGICLLDRSQLVCVDPFTGETVWQRFNILPRSEILGGGETVIVWNPFRRVAKVFSVASGELLRESTLPMDLGSIWHTGKEGVLLSKVITTAKINQNSKSDGDEEETDNAKPDLQFYQQLTFFDFVTGEVIWERKLDHPSKGTKTSDQRIAVLSESGQFQIIDFETGETINQTEIRLSEKQLKEITVFDVETDHANYLIKIHTSLNKTSTRISSTSSKYYFRNAISNQMFWNGYLISVDRRTGQQNWDRPVRMNYYQLTRNRPYKCPFIFALRRVDLRSSNISDRYWIQVNAIDAKTGKLVAFEKSPKYYYNDYRIRVFPERNTVEFGIPDMRFEFVSTDTPSPPRPIANLSDIVGIKFEEESQTTPFTEDSEKIEAERKKLIAELIEAQKRGDLKRRQQAMKKQLEAEQKAPLKKKPDGGNPGK